MNLGYTLSSGDASSLSDALDPGLDSARNIRVPTRALTKLGPQPRGHHLTRRGRLPASPAVTCVALWVGWVRNLLEPFPGRGEERQKLLGKLRGGPLTLLLRHREAGSPALSASGSASALWPDRD